jgi:hypothetical protein
MHRSSSDSLTATRTRSHPEPFSTCTLCSLWPTSHVSSAFGSCCTRLLLVVRPWSSLRPPAPSVGTVLGFQLIKLSPHGRAPSQPWPPRCLALVARPQLCCANAPAMESLRAHLHSDFAKARAVPWRFFLRRAPGSSVGRAAVSCSLLAELLVQAAFLYSATDVTLSAAAFSLYFTSLCVVVPLCSPRRVELSRRVLFLLGRPCCCSLHVRSSLCVAVLPPQLPLVRAFFSSARQDIVPCCSSLLNRLLVVCAIETFRAVRSSVRTTSLQFQYSRHWRIVAALCVLAVFVKLSWSCCHFSSRRVHTTPPPSYFWQAPTCAHAHHPLFDLVVELRLSLSLSVTLARCSIEDFSWRPSSFRQLPNQIEMWWADSLFLLLVLWL